uniref:Uncharacterized protein n=1 Tax=Avena sativa TaxID=4498 RepID=A0ACD5W6P5_AVESA
MKISALLTSAGINIGLCVLFWSLYSVLRKQPAFVRVYFGRRIAEEHRLLREAFIMERFVPSTGWIVKAIQCTEEEILAAAGLDAVALNRMLVFSIRIFSLAAILCLFGILPLHYFGQNMHHLEIPSEQLHIFTISNVEVQSRWLWVHCVVLYIISGVACILLYIEYRHIARLRLLHLKRATLNPGQFTVLVRGIPKTTKESCSSDIGDFFTKYHASSYLFHQVVYKAGKVQKIMIGAKKACGKMIISVYGRSITTFFITYVLTSGWASLSSELMQLFGLIWNFIRKYVLRMKEDTTFVPTFPYHTEIPKVMLFILLGFSCSVLAPLILPFLLVYFFLGYVVYRNQLLNVYRTRYDTGGLYWPIAHNTVIFSLVLTQIICLGVFGLKESPVAAGFTIPLIILTLLFNQYCRKRLLPLFKTFPAQDLIDLDREDERLGRMEHIHDRLHTAYCQFPETEDIIELEKIKIDGNGEEESCSSGESKGKENPQEQEPRRELSHPTLKGLPVSRLQNAVRSITFLIRLHKRGVS